MFILRCLGSAAVFATLIIGCNDMRNEQRNVVFVFEDAKGIEAGAPVMYKGLAVGRVLRVHIGEDGSVEVDTQVSEDLRQQLREPCTAFIEKMKSDEGEPVDVVVVYLGDRALASGPELTTIEGCDSRPELLLWQAANMARSFAQEHEEELESVKQAARDAAQAAQRAGEKVKEFAESEDMKELREKLEKFAAQTGQKAEETYSELRKQWPELAERLDDVYKRLEELGSTDEARQLRESIERLFEPVPTATADEGKT